MNVESWINSDKTGLPSLFSSGLVRAAPVTLEPGIQFRMECVFWGGGNYWLVCGEIWMYRDDGAGGGTYHSKLRGWACIMTHDGVRFKILAGVERPLSVAGAKQAGPAVSRTPCGGIHCTFPKDAFTTNTAL